MSTAVVHPAKSEKVVNALPGRRYDHFFFPVMAWLMLATVFEGFARTYYLAGVFHAPLPSLIIHVHGAAFSCWILLLIAQTSLVLAGRVDIHRRLGIAGFGLACLMVILGVMAATDSLVRGGGPPGRDVRFFYIVPLTAVLIFGTLIASAFRARSDSPAHKRFILIGTVAILLAATARWPNVNRNLRLAENYTYIFLLLLVIYDLWSTRRIHRVTLWGSGFLILMQQISVPIGQTAAWHAFAGWVQSMAG